MSSINPVYSVSDFIALVNQTLEYAYPFVVIEGEISGFNINQDKFIFFDLKDEQNSIGCFMMIFQLKMPIENGMKVRIQAQPKLTNKGKFSLTVINIIPIGEGNLKKAFDMLKLKLEKEGLFSESRKRSLEKYPSSIGLISSWTASGANDFLTILNQRWGGLTVKFANVQVQGEKSPDQIVSAIEFFNQQAKLVDTLAIIRGGGSLDDLWAFNTEPVVRAIASSRIPTVVGVGHEDDISLSDLAADLRASTPTQAAQLIVPDKKQVISDLTNLRRTITNSINSLVGGILEDRLNKMTINMKNIFIQTEQKILFMSKSLDVFNPSRALKRGYSIIRLGEKVIGSIKMVKKGNIVSAEVADGIIKAEVINARNQTNKYR